MMMTQNKRQARAAPKGVHLGQCERLVFEHMQNWHLIALLMSYLLVYQRSFFLFRTLVVSLGLPLSSEMSKQALNLTSHCLHLSSAARHAI
jgi:hypothetical protein